MAAYRYIGAVGSDATTQISQLSGQHQLIVIGKAGGLKCSFHITCGS